MLRIVWVVGFLSSLASAEALDLKTTERLFLDYNFAQKADGAEIRAAHEDVTKKYAEVLPKLDFKSSYIFDGRREMSLHVEQPVPFPMRWSKEREVLDLGEDIARKTQSANRQDLINTLRKAYFGVQLLEKKKELYQQSFAIVERFQKQSEHRFGRGYIAQADLKRAKLQYLDLSREVLELNADLESSKRQLFFSLGNKVKMQTLATELKVGDAFLNVNEKELREELSHHSNENLAIAQLKSESTRLRAENSAYAYLPELSFQARIPVEKQNDRSERYSATLSWNLFAGGSDRAEQRKAYALREQADYALREQLTQHASNSDKTVNSLLAGRASYIKLKEGLKMWEEILASDHQRFQQGLISNKDLSDDITAYLKYANDVHQQTFELVSALSDFCVLAGKEELFHKFVM